MPEDPPCARVCWRLDDGTWTRGRPRRGDPPAPRGERDLDAPVPPGRGHLESVPLADRARTARAVPTRRRRDRTLARDFRRRTLRRGGDRADARTGAVERPPGAGVRSRIDVAPAPHAARRLRRL